MMRKVIRIRIRIRIREKRVIELSPADAKNHSDTKKSSLVYSGSVTKTEIGRRNALRGPPPPPSLRDVI